MDLNPLSNPLLAANLGRWAEVYFTNPPQQREHAVAVLLRELEIEAAAKPAVLERHEAVVAGDHSTAAPNAQQIEQPIVRKLGMDCASCGHHNREGHSFCGMCGVPLTDASLEHSLEMTQLAPLREEPGILDENIDEHLDLAFASEGNEPLSTSDTPAEEGESTHQATLPEYSDLPSFARRPEPTPYRYRLYVGVVVAILLGGLIYVAKRGDLLSDGQQSPDAKVIPAPQQPAPQEPIPNIPAAQNNAADAPLPVEKTEKNENAAQPKVEAKLPPGTLERTQQAPPQPAPRSAQVMARTAAAPPSAVAAEGQGGAADLAAAERYLSSGQGAVRDPRQALPLLWDAVAKGNASATLALSDLYLRGDGVAQNCDQARLLLDIAAKKGAKGAGERLRHLPAFGCR